ncbi:DUF2493 domain-containing protein [Mycobacteroides abscessus]|uniref:SLOG family protein n=1 Tax=Mycobacteroides abscessus TaxID=36809 RepID=UPI000D3EA0A2|nr:SLOG family protein [Mycobacteroides abscessus]PVB46375.1 hypothetical protein DDK10_24550 [Mycobacteroides abscessus]RIR66432.1 DUF2493 domain-containing protein [Mycobacteroides abscessus]
MRRVLITGSRNWSDRRVIHSALFEELMVDTGQPEDVTVIHGAASGADSLAAWVASSLGMTTEAHPAQWDRPCEPQCFHKPRMKNGKPYCPLAGHLRNQHMVDLGADVCHAFPLLDSRGTWDCVRRAEKAGIRVVLH